MKNSNNCSKINFLDRAKQLKNYILFQDLGIPDLIKGCSKLEILQLEKKYAVILPRSYKVFLENFGRGLGGKIMRDCDVLYDDIFSLTNIIRNEILIDDGDPVLPNKAFVCVGRYNEQFMFFDASGMIEEPDIYYYHIDEGNFRKIADSIFEIIEDELEVSYELEKYRKKFNK